MTIMDRFKHSVVFCTGQISRTIPQAKALDALEENNDSIEYAING